MRGIANAMVAASVLSMAGYAFAHDRGHALRPAARPPVVTEFGRPGDARKATRTIRVDMADTRRFTPEAISVKHGETVQFVVSNSGKMPHEMTIGTAQALREHAGLMRKHPGMEHGESHMAPVAPGKSGDIVWTFTQAGEFEFGCLVPGHFEAGMRGRIRVLPGRERQP